MSKPLINWGQVIFRKSFSKHKIKNPDSSLVIWFILTLSFSLTPLFISLCTGWTVPKIWIDKLTEGEVQRNLIVNLKPLLIQFYMSHIIWHISSIEIELYTTHIVSKSLSRRFAIFKNRRSVYLEFYQCISGDSINNSIFQKFNISWESSICLTQIKFWLVDQ